MTTPGSVPSSERVVPGSFNIPIAQWPSTTKDENVDAPAVASKIVNSFNELLSKKDHKGIANLFLEKSYWRDHLGLTWDFRTMKGRDKIIALLDKGYHLKDIQIDRELPAKNNGPELTSFRADGSVRGIQFFLRASTKHGFGPGYAWLAQDNGEWKIWALYTSMHELYTNPEPVGRLRPNGVVHGVNHQRSTNWLERRQNEINFVNGDPDVLIIGCGQAGLSLQARLKMMGVPTLAIDVCDNVGDNWRNRYRHLVLHDAIWYDHMPYIKFPDFWPIFTPKDKLAQFLQSYAEQLELNIWNNTSLEYSSWDDKKKEWVAVVKRQKKDGTIEVRVLHPKHIVQCTGHSGKKNTPSFKGMENFKGDVLCHSSEFKGAKTNAKGRKAVVIGACNSALDICHDLQENGYDVTIIQRSSTCVMGVQAVVDLMLKPSYCEGGPPIEEADVVSWGKPGEIYKALHSDMTEKQQVVDKDVLERLNKAGFKTDRGPMNCGLSVKYFQRGGGYYIDVGASQLLIEGKIKVKHGVGVSEVLPHGVKLDDGTELEADEIVCATGYQNMRTATEAIFGEEVASKVPNVFGYDEEGEMKVVWRQSGHPGLWLHAGNLALCRYFSKLVAIQIKAQLDGISPQ
ncbi:FAD/NAD(P)-binding domain-containing protein [Daldinia sp. FL1419]|nr:FAD/NAD(P)-binding domain-containing protein [Daldinia sp. FL1419]